MDIAMEQTKVCRKGVFEERVSDTFSSLHPKKQRKVASTGLTLFYDSFQLLIKGNELRIQLPC